ncbi:MAG: hypothetical protein RLZZ182_2182 [Pseudomonadota bacterium]
MSKFNLARTAWSGRAVALSTLTLIGSSAQAGIDPLSVTVSESVSYDNNYLRNDNAKKSELVSATSLTLALDKSYGRQRYTLSATGTAQRNRNYKQFSNDGYSVAASLSSSIGANSYGALAAQAGKSLQNPDEQSGVRQAQDISTRTASAYLLHGLYSRLGGTASLQTSKTEYSLTREQDKQQVGGRVGVRYNPSDRVSFDLGYKRSDVELVNITTAARKINRSDIDLNTSWFVSGYTNLRGSVAFSRERRPGTQGFDFDGVTGSLSWDFTPGGRTSYGVSFSRDTSNAGQGTSISVQSDATTVASFSNPTQNLLTNTLSASLRYSLTSKVKLAAGMSYSQYSNVLNASSTSVTQLNDISGFEKASVDTVGLNTGFSFQPYRMVSMGCNLQAYSRGKSRLGPSYKGEALGCTASLTLD